MATAHLVSTATPTKQVTVDVTCVGKEQDQKLISATAIASPRHSTATEEADCHLKWPLSSFTSRFVHKTSQREIEQDRPQAQAAL
eukprot:scaffold42662_cov183-Skeletonema_marinoi.AAC.1